MTHDLWVSMPIIRNIIMHAASKTADIQMMCNAGNITISDLDDSEQRLTLTQNCAIMDAAMTVSNDPHLGLHMGEKTTQSVLGTAGYLMESSKDVYMALQNLQHYTRTFTRLYDFKLEVNQHAVIYYCEPLELWNDISPDTAMLSVDFAFTGTLHILRLLTGRIIQPQKVIYRYLQPSDVHEHERILKCKPMYKQSANCMIFSLTDMQLPIIGYNKELNHVFKQLLDKTLQQEEGDSNIIQQVRHILLQQYQLQFPSLEDVAEIMNISSRTLQRKLQEENTSFRTVSDNIKHELARSLLTNNNLTIAEIGYKLGYTEPGAFQRAFRQWTGTTPGSFRQATE